MTTPRHPLVNFVHASFFSTTAFLLKVLPDRMGLMLMRSMGGLGYVLLYQRRKTAAVRLEQALGLPPTSPESRQILRASCDTIARSLFESWWLDGIEKRHPERIEVRVVGLEHLKSEIAKGRGVLLVGSHFSSFLQMARFLVPHIGPIHSLARTRKNPRLQALFDAGPMRFLSERVGMDGAVQALLRWLRGGKVVTIFVDQRARRGAGVVLDFLGMPARHQSLAGRLAVRTGAALMPIYCQHFPGEHRYQLTIEPALEPLQSASRDEVESELTQRLSASLSEQVSDLPGHYMWFHDRWRGEVPEDAVLPKRSVATVGQGTRGR